MKKETLIAAAFAGMMLGTSVSAQASPNGDRGQGLRPGPTQRVDDMGQGEKHACKGKNSCKGKGGCKTDKHACKGQNECKGQGGCATDGSKKK